MMELFASFLHSKRNLTDRAGPSPSKTVLLAFLSIVVLVSGDPAEANPSHAREFREHGEADSAREARTERHKESNARFGELVRGFIASEEATDAFRDGIRASTIQMSGQRKAFLSNRKPEPERAEKYRLYKEEKGRLADREEAIVAQFKESSGALDELNRHIVSMSSDRFEDYNFFIDDGGAGTRFLEDSLMHLIPDGRQVSGDITNKTWQSLHNKADKQRKELRRELVRIHGEIQQNEGEFEKLARKQQDAFLRRNKLDNEFAEYDKLIELEGRVDQLNQLQNAGQLSPNAGISSADFTLLRELREKKINKKGLDKRRENLNAEIGRRDRKLWELQARETTLLGEARKAVKNAAETNRRWHASIRDVIDGFFDPEEPAPQFPTAAMQVQSGKAKETSRSASSAQNENDLIYSFLRPEPSNQQAPNETASNAQVTGAGRSARSLTYANLPSETNGTPWGNLSHMQLPAGNENEAIGAAASSSASRTQTPPRRSGPAGQTLVRRDRQQGNESVRQRVQASNRPLGVGVFPPSGTDGTGK